jgi:hypothetical protein
VVRAELKAAGWIIRAVDPAGTASHCTYFSMSDLRGNIPKRIVDMATRPQPLQIANISSFLAKDRTGAYALDLERLRNGFSDADVVHYLNRLNRRLLPDSSGLYPWLYTGGGTGAAAAGDEARARLRSRSGSQGSQAGGANATASQAGGVNTTGLQAGWAKGAGLQAAGQRRRGIDWGSVAFTAALVVLAVALVGAWLSRMLGWELPFAQ